MDQRMRRACRHLPVCIVSSSDDELQSLPHVIDIGTDLYLQQIRVMELSLDAPVMDGEEPTLGDAVAADVDIEAGADRQEVAQAVNEAVDRLPEKQRDLVRLCDLQGRSLSDAARVCGTSLPSAQNTHKTAQKRCFLTKICVLWRSPTNWTNGRIGIIMSELQTTAALGFQAPRRSCLTGKTDAKSS